METKKKLQILSIILISFTAFLTILGTTLLFTMGMNIAVFIILILEYVNLPATITLLIIIENKLYKLRKKEIKQ